MLSQRLDRLETDLKVLNAMQDLFLQFELDEGGSENATFSGRSVNPEHMLLNHPPGPIASDDIPERDVKLVKYLNNKRQIRQSTTKSTSELTSNKTKRNSNKTYTENNFEGHSQNNPKTGQSQTTNENPNDNKTHSPTPTTYLADMEKTATKLTEDLEKERQVLKENIEREQSLRAEVEESAKHVYIQLQKVEDELEREKKTKESLLMGTLQLKNLIHGYDSKVKESNESLALSKAEIQRLSSELHELSTENTKTLKRLKYLCIDLGYTKDRIEREFKSVEGDDKARKYLECLKSKIQELLKKVANAESEKVRALTSELNAALGRSEKLEKEGQETSIALQQCQSREEHLKHQLHMSQVSLSTVESELLKKQVEYECTLQQFRSDSQIEKEASAIKFSEYMSVIRRTKELLMTLRNERDKCRKDFQEANAQNQGLTKRLKATGNEKHGLMGEVQTLTQKIYLLSKEKLEVEEKSRSEKCNFEATLQKSVVGKRKCMELLSAMKYQLVNVKSKCQHESGLLQEEKRKLLAENQRLDENFRVLQKVSGDQGQTIQKLRGDLDTMKSINFKLDSQLRDYECSENKLIQKLEQSEKKVDNYIKRIEHLEDKLERYAEDVRTHDCDEYVDSKYKRKWDEIEKSFRLESQKLEETLEDVEKERDEALQAARETLEKVDELRTHQTSQLAQVKAQFQTDMNVLAERYNKQDLEKENKIHELQSELDRTKLSSSQIQRALSTKIQQLQGALNICIGGSTQNNNSSLGLLHQLHHHHPVAAFSNVGSVNNNGCANNNGASFANLLLNPGPGGGTQTQAQTTCFGNSNVNGCTSGILSEPFGCIGNLIL